VRAENYFRRHFDDAAVGDNFKNYYYGMFNFAKAMRRRARAGHRYRHAGRCRGRAWRPSSTTPERRADVPTAAKVPQVLDWYNDSVNGLARTIIDYQILPGNPNTEGVRGNVSPTLPEHRRVHGPPGQQSGQRTRTITTSPGRTQILTRSLFQAGSVARRAAAAESDRLRTSR
jgi:hypothetical protein